MPALSASDRPSLTPVQWLICTMAAIGFAFDIYELLMLPLILPPALAEFGFKPGTEEFAAWVGRMFYIPAFAGGVFGLLGGYLTDRLGRRRVLTWSILLYSVSAFLAAYATSPEMLIVLRSAKFIGVCVEFVAAVAWLAELFPDPHRREKVLGYTQAFSSIGGLLIAIANGLAIEYAARLPAIGLPEWLAGLGAIKDPHAPWRYTMISGLIPALPLVIIRPFLPESPAWQQKRAAGTLKRPSIAELFSPMYARTTIVATLMFACSYGAAFGAIQHIPQIVPGLADVQAKSQAAVADAVEKQPELAASPKDVARVKSQVSQKVASEYTKIQEIGGLFGRFALAMIAVPIVSRRSLLRVFQIPGLIIVPLVFYLFLTVENTNFFTIDLSAIRLGHLPITTVTLGVLLAGFFTVAQFSFWGNYLPRMYPIHLRGTGESFAANIGGRMIGTSFAWVTSTLSIQLWVKGETPPEKIALAAAAVALFVYLAGSLLCFFLPEPKHEDLPD